jgi:hypothetical protein
MHIVLDVRTNTNLPAIVHEVSGIYAYVQLKDISSFKAATTGAPGEGVVVDAEATVHSVNMPGIIADEEKLEVNFARRLPFNRTRY